MIELYQTFNVRFGVMTVGPTGGGKTTCCQLLQTAQSNLKASGTCEDAEMAQTVHTYVFNPKCISMGELYGELLRVRVRVKVRVRLGLRLGLGLELLTLTQPQPQLPRRVQRAHPGVD